MSTFSHHPYKHDGPWMFDASRTYSQEKSWCKPVGFWLSVDDDWRRYCESEELEWAAREAVEFEVDTDACLWLRTVEDIDRFDREYVGRQDPYRIDWVPLTQQFAGIIIAPYQWQRRLARNASWYYPWDCASACIWDLSVLSVREQVSA